LLDHPKDPKRAQCWSNQMNSIRCLQPFAIT